MSVSVRVGGWWLRDIAAYGELTWSHAADGGCKEASWRMNLPRTFMHTALTRSRLVEVLLGPAPVWTGALTEPDVDDEWTFHAVGLSALGNDYLCFDGSLNTTSKPNTAIDQAIADGLPWVRPSSLSSSALAAGDQTESLNKLGDLLDAWADSVGKRWGVNAAREVFAVADPVSPTWHLTPGVGRMGLADDEYASDLYIRYLATAGGFATEHAYDAAARARHGYRAFPVDATTKGPLSAPQAALLGNALLEKGKARQSWTNGVEVTREQLTTPGGTPAFLPLVKAGEMVRMHGVRDEQGQLLAYVDWVIGETSHVAGSDTISLTPVGLADRTLADVMSAALGGAA